MTDTAVSRRLFIEMQVAEQQQFVEHLRARRLRVVEEHRKLVAERDAAQRMQWKDKLTEQLRMIERDIASAERALERVEGRVNKIAAWRAALEV